MDIKDILETKIRKLEKTERLDFLEEHIPDIALFFIKKGHHSPDKVKLLFDKMEDPKEKMALTLLKLLKRSKEEEREVNLGIVSVIGDFLEKRSSKLDQDLIDMYADIVDKILKPRVKKVSKDLGLNKDLIKELLVIVPDKEYISSAKYVGIYVNKILRKLYYMSHDPESDTGITSTKMLIKLFKTMFEKDILPDIAINILLERKEAMRNFNDKQLTIWNLLTDSALIILNKLEKDELFKYIENYIERRARDAEKGYDNARRIQLTQLPENYEKISKVVNKLSGKERNKKFL